ncbi:hypothetical protein A9W98_20745 [Mycobacterium gordonae]|uniref:Uncharacterized protein n=1 Tax=Mycobacterium gordonae TaxID=1778 RepID=A0A1A6BG46_MYCGO|nr:MULTISPECIES: hypothetical protein [Mycobacterium]OBS01342.1 hypothetical protein A9W98_20745 [Mycobacterium gordonae]PJE00662.1 MAG: hypothetical protein CK428_32155 [Mycobacterium sp.]
MPPLTGPDRLLFDQVTASLREADHFEQIFESDDLSGVDKLRSIGRRVGRELGWKIRTFASELDTGRVRVLIVVERSTPLRDQLMDTRRRKSMRGAMAEIWSDDDLRPAD